MQGVTFCNSGISGKIHVWTWPKLHTPREYHGQQCMTRKCHQFPLEGPKIGPQNQHFFQTKICKKLRLACCYALHVKWLRLACCGRRRGEMVLLGYSQRCSSPRKYTNTQIHKYTKTTYTTNTAWFKSSQKVTPCMLGYTLPLNLIF